MHTYESITTLDMLHMLDVLGIPKKTGSTADGHRLIGQGTWWTTCRRPRQRRTLWIWEAAQDGSPCWWRGGNSKVQHDVLQEWNDNDCETYHSCTIYIYTYINIHYIYVCACDIIIIDIRYVYSYLGWSTPMLGMFCSATGCVWKWGIPGSHSQHGNTWQFLWGKWMNMRGSKPI